MLAVHSSFWAKPNRRWGLPGGGIEWREAPEVAVKRELREELELTVDAVTEVGAYPYKGHQHMVFGADIDRQITYYDDSELLDIGWFSRAEIDDFAKQGKLHAGYEHDAIATFFAQTKII